MPVAAPNPSAGDYGDGHHQPPKTTQWTPAFGHEAAGHWAGLEVPTADDYSHWGRAQRSVDRGNKNETPQS